jgi:hypothetical protein
VSVIGVPPRPVKDPDWTGVKFGQLPADLVDGIKVLIASGFILF